MSLDWATKNRRGVERWSQVLSRRRPPARDLALFVAAYMFAAGTSQLIAIIPGTGISLWPPSGLFLAVLACRRRLTWPWWALAALSAELISNLLWFHNAWPVALGIFTGNMLEAMTGAYLLHRAGGWPYRWRTLWDVLAFVLLAAGIAPMLSGTIGAATLWLADSQPFVRSWALFWIGDATGVLVVAPFALVMLAWRRMRPLHAVDAAEVGAISALLVGGGALSLGGYLPFAFITMPALLWAAIRFEFRGAAIGLVGIAAMTLLFTAMGISQFAGDPATQAQNNVLLQIYLAISAITGLIVAGMSRQHRRAVEDLRTVNLELESRVMARTSELQAAAGRTEIAQETGRAWHWEYTLPVEAVIQSGAMATVTGYEPADFMKLETWRTLMHPDDALLVWPTVSEGIAGGGFSVEYRLRHRDGHYIWVHDQARVVEGTDGRRQVVGMTFDITETKLREQQMRLLMREVNHRAKNILSLVQAIARQTVAGDPKAFVERFSERIRALAANQDLLVANNWQGVDLDSLARAQLAPFADLIGTRITLSGGPIRLSAGAAQSLGLALHELATNAAKYGALAAPAGHIDVAWSVDASTFSISWVETSETSVTAPTRKGFGTRAIASMAKLSVDGEVEMDYAPTGLRWTLRCPASNALEAGLGQS